MFLGLRSDGPVAELKLYEVNGTLRGEKVWQADRQLAYGLLGQLDVFLKEHGASIQGLRGLFVFQGPGSFTGLRIGLTVMNTLAYADAIPIVGEAGDDWCAKAVLRLREGDNDQIVMPLYGSDARITLPKK